MSKTKSAAEKKLRLTVKLLDERQRLVADLAKIAAQNDSKRKRLAQIDCAAKQHLESNESDSCTKGKYVIDYEMKNGRVPWKDAYISVAGDDSAARLQANVPATKRLRITRK